MNNKNFLRLISTAALGALLLPAVTGATTLYGATRGGGIDSSFLYSIDTTTGAATLIGDIGFVVNGLTHDATTDTLYATTWSGSTEPPMLITVSRSTGAGTAIGPTGVFATWGAAADSMGRVYGWTESGDDPVRFDVTTGMATVVGTSGVGTAGGTLAFDNDDNLVLVQNTTVYSIDLATGAASIQGELLGRDDDFHHGDFDPDTNLLWMVNGPGTNVATALVIADLSTLMVTGTLELSGITAGSGDLHTLAFATPAPIPLPAGLPLLLSALAWLGWSGLRRH